MQYIKATDRNFFKYCGVWQTCDKENPDVMVGSWNAPYFEVVFSGKTLYLHFQKNIYLDITLDGKTEKNCMVEGKYTVNAETCGKHTLRVCNPNRTKRAYFEGISIPDGETLTAADKKPHYIEFVGDSISDNGNSFSFHIGDRLNWDFAIKARSAMALQNGRGGWRRTVSEKFDVFPYVLGMEETFFKTVCPDDFLEYANVELLYKEWCNGDFDIDFSKVDYFPDIVFIFLGTNDDLYPWMEPIEHTETFIKHYVSFVRDIKKVYGENTKICVLQALTNSGGPPDDTVRFDAIDKAFEALKENFGDTVRLINRKQIISWNIDISDDTTHPSNLGYAQLTDCIAPILKEWYE